MSRKTARKRPPRPAPEPVRATHQHPPRPAKTGPGRPRSQAGLLKQIFVGPLPTRSLIATSLVIGLLLMLSPIVTILVRSGQSLPLPLLLALLVLGAIGTIMVYNGVRSSVLRSRRLLPPSNSARPRNQR